jgi:hypothetical protein
MINVFLFNGATISRWAQFIVIVIIFFDMGICQIIIGVVVLMIIIIKIKTIGTIIIIIIIIIMAVFGSGGIFTSVGNAFIRGTVRRSIDINDGLMFGRGRGGSVMVGIIFACGLL